MALQSVHTDTTRRRRTTALRMVTTGRTGSTVVSLSARGRGITDRGTFTGMLTMRWTIAKGIAVHIQRAASRRQLSGCRSMALQCTISVATRRRRIVDKLRAECGIAGCFHQLRLFRKRIDDLHAAV